MSDSIDKVQSHKWQLTFNNPVDHGFTRERILEVLHGIRGKDIYFCLCDETGHDGTYHTHVFLYRPRSCFLAKTLANWFPGVHREKAFGTPYEIGRAHV